MNQINCLRCRQCKLLPETDMTQSAPVVWCEKKQDRMPLILSGCGIANPGFRYQRVNGKFRNVEGDRTRNVSDAEKAYLRAWYSVLSWPMLERRIGRPRTCIIPIANRLGLERGDNEQRRKEAAARGRVTRGKSGHIFNAKQAACIEGCFARDFWPKKQFGKEPLKSESDAIRAEIVARVAELDSLGRTWKWESIRSHMKWRSPSYQRNMKARNKQRRPYHRSWEERKRAVSSTPTKSHRSN